MSIAQGRVGRVAEIFDLIGGGTPPDAMFVARPNVITVQRGWVDANVRVQYLHPPAVEGGQPLHLEHTFPVRFPLDRWEHLTVDLSDANPDDSVVVDQQGDQ